MLRSPLIFFVLYCFCISLEIVAQSYPKRELRAAWIATVANIDWPSRRDLSTHQQQEEYVRILDTLKSIGMNAVIVQVRPMADAFYPSSHEPWSVYLSGIQGQGPQPYYNPMTFMIEQAHQRGLEFHAWFNPYRVTANEESMLHDQHPLYQHPTWFVRYGGKLYYDPGHPEAQEYVLKTILETVKHYDLDAVHFDDYFYPYRIANEEFPDSASYQQFGMARFVVKNDWRRDNVNYFVKELSTRIKQEKPHVKFGISPFGVWRNKENDADGSETQAGQTNYDDLYADVLLWLRYGWIDYIAPQLYWHIGFEVADYKTLIKWWADHAFGKHLYIGQGIYRVGQKGWEDPDEIINQILLNRSYSNVNGSMYFSAKYFLNNNQNANEKMRSLYPYPALIPTMDWMAGEAPSPPTINLITGSQGKGVDITWSDSTTSVSSYYAVYRFDDKAEIDFDNPKNIKAIVQRKPYSTQGWRDVTTNKRTRYTYAVTALDRLHNESTPSQPIDIKTRGKNGKIKLE